MVARIRYGGLRVGIEIAWYFSEASIGVSLIELLQPDVFPSHSSYYLLKRPDVVLTQENVEGKLEEVDLHRKGKGHAKGSKNLYERIQGRSSTIGKIQREAMSANCKRFRDCRQHASPLV
uniref:hypothetical protein n=1 Tax=Reticulibacter mediterranei TaxID=2778369 RepID=UPI001C68A3C5|nr:hypothetical protein [Reticulibacter mediterranei]